MSTAGKGFIFGVGKSATFHDKQLVVCVCEEKKKSFFKLFHGGHALKHKIYNNHCVSLPFACVCSLAPPAMLDLTQPAAQGETSELGWVLYVALSVTTRSESLHNVSRAYASASTVLES